MSLSAQTDFKKSKIVNMMIDGGSSIFLAGRTDVNIPPASDLWSNGTYLVRHPKQTPEEIQERLPPFVNITAGDVIRLADPAVGGVSFFNGFGPPFFGPSGNGDFSSNLNSLDGISGYIGPQGALTGVFLDDSIPSAKNAPNKIDFTTSGMGVNFLTITPQIGQVFYLGDGMSNSGDFQKFVAPVGATRIFFGIPDGFGFVGNPGAYDDNDGNYSVRIGVNRTPELLPKDEVAEQEKIKAEVIEIIKVIQKVKNVDFDITFEGNHWKLKDSAKNELNKLGAVLSSDVLNNGVFELIGHVAGRGGMHKVCIDSKHKVVNNSRFAMECWDTDNAWAQTLSERRAQSVRDYLLKNFTIPAGRIKAYGVGHSQHKFNNPDDAGNRRVEVKYIKKERI